jgi:hypothetical protein
MLAQALVDGSAEADRELCARAMGALYSAHAGAVGVLPACARVCPFAIASFTIQEPTMCTMAQQRYTSDGPCIQLAHACALRLSTMPICCKRMNRPFIARRLRPLPLLDESAFRRSL